MKQRRKKIPAPDLCSNPLTQEGGCFFPRLMWPGPSITTLSGLLCCYQNHGLVVGGVSDAHDKEPGAILDLLEDVMTMQQGCEPGGVYAQ